MTNFTKIILTTLILAILSACSTETGNPNTAPGDNTASGETVIVSTDKILNRSCLIISKCHSIELQTCYDGWLAADNIDIKIGLPEGVYNNFSEIIKAERNEIITASPLPLEVCLSEISSLNCYSEGVEDAYDNNAEDPFASTGSLLPSSCAEVF